MLWPESAQVSSAYSTIDVGLNLVETYPKLQGSLSKDMNGRHVPKAYT